MTTIAAFPSIPSAIFGSYLSFTGQASATIKTGQIVISDPANAGYFKPAPANGVFSGLIPIGVSAIDVAAGEYFAIITSGIAYVGNSDDATAIARGAPVKIGAYAGAVALASPGDTVVGIVLSDGIPANGYGRITIALSNISYPALGEPADFLIWLSGTTYCAKNCSTGIIQFAGVVYRTVLDQVIAALPATGSSSIMDVSKATSRTPTVYHFIARKLRHISGLEKVDFESPEHELSDWAPTNPVISNAHYNGPGNSMCRANNGDLLYFNRNGHDHFGTAAVVDLYRSRDGGHTWGVPVTILTIANKDPRNYCAGVTNTGRIILVYLPYDYIGSTWPDGQYIYSDDHGYTWSLPQDITSPALAGHTPGHLYADSRMESLGTIKSIGEDKIGFAYDCWTATEDWTQIRFCWSDDEGMTWNHILVGETTIAGAWWCEPDFTYLGGNQLVCMAREQNAIGINMFTSTDNGLTWTDRGSTTLGGYITGTACMPRLFSTVEARYRKVWAILTVSRNITGGGQMFAARGTSIIANGVTAWDTATRLQFNLGAGGTVGNEYQTAWFHGNKGIILAENQISGSDERINEYIVHPFADWALFATPFNSTNHTCGLEGDAALPTSTILYGVNCPVMIYCTGGVGMSIKITDNIAGATVADGLADLVPPIFVSPSMTIKFTFTGTPTITVMPVHSGNYE